MRFHSIKWINYLQISLATLMMVSSYLMIAGYSPNITGTVSWLAAFIFVGLQVYELRRFRKYQEQITQEMDEFLQLVIADVYNDDGVNWPIQWPDDCLYFSGSKILKCPVSPSERCQTCSHFEKRLPSQEEWLDNPY